MIESSKLGIFWQFVGLGQSYYGVLEELDDLPGRFIDNADFFALDDIDTVSDSELYDRLFNEYPQWLVQARQNEFSNRSSYQTVEVQRNRLGMAHNKRQASMKTKLLHAR